MTTFLYDLRYSFRAIRKSPLFSAGVIATAVLAIGSNAAIFSVAHAVLLRQLPYRDPERVVWMWSRQTVRQKAAFNLADFLDYREGNTVFEHLSAMLLWNATLTTPSEPEHLQGLRVTADLFETLGVNAILGRTLHPGDDRPGSAKVAVLTHGLWTRRFGGNPSILGAKLVLDGDAYTVVGVLPPHFFFPLRDTEIAAPLMPEADPERAVRAAVSRLRVVGRLRTGVSPQRARDAMTSIAARLQHEYPDTNSRKAAVALIPIADEILGSYRAGLWALVAAVAGVLVIACANLANLTLARGSARSTEIATRLALGASSKRVVRQLLTESMLLAAIGGIGGILAASLGVRGLIALSPADLPRVNDIAVDAPVLLFTLAATLAAGISFGLIPAFAAAKADLNLTLRDGSRGSSDGPRKGRAQRGLIAAEVAIAVVLLIVVGLFARSLSNLQAVHLGFNPRGAVSTRISLPRTRYATTQTVNIYQQKVLANLTALPSIQAAGAISALPLSGYYATIDFIIDGRPVTRDRLPTAHYRVVTPGYFSAMRIPILRGRGFSDLDTETTRRVAVVNQSLASRFLDGRNPIGARILIDDDNAGMRPLEIVGVSGDVRQLSLDGESTLDVYLPYRQMHPDTLGFAANMFWVVRGEIANAARIEEIRAALRQADSQIPIPDPRPVEETIAASIASRRFTLLVLGLFAAAAVLLAAAGIYAMLTYSLSRRAREFAIRSALGASRGHLLLLILRQAAAPAVLGIVAGVVAAFAIARSIASMLYGLSASDPITFIAVPAILLLVSLSACVGPGLRASRAAITGTPARII